jgi:hypothetical protein
MIFAKINVLLTIMDDTYDEHATIEECRMLNEAAQRLDFSILVPGPLNFPFGVKRKETPSVHRGGSFNYNYVLRWKIPIIINSE